MSLKSLLVAPLLIFFIVSPSLSQLHGSDCSHSVHCEIGVGLICHPETSRCVCSNGLLTDSLRYTMEWDRTELQCFAVEGSACIGTSTRSTQTVKCATGLTCVQAEHLPIGQGTCKNIPKTNNIGATCDQNNYCDASLGLICGEERTCVCGHGQLSNEHSFQLDWDEGKGVCVAETGSPCIGTRFTPVAAGMKAIECATGECVQLANHPPGVGVCGGRDGGDGGSSTTPDGATGVRGSVLAIALCGVLAALLTR